tara:strand:- start:1125 stop:1880 length:756 start_codon:yes stop_codon:yes gene_type:complete
MAGFLGLGPDPIKHDFDYDVNQTQYNTDPRLDRSYNLLNSQGGRLNTMAAKFERRADEFLDPNSSWMRGNRMSMAKDIYDASGQQANVLNQMLAQRGAGGMAGLIGAMSTNRASETARKGYQNLLNQGVGYAQNYSNMGLNALGQATSAYGQSGQLAQGIDARATQVALANSAAINQRNQYANQGLYEMKAGNAARQDAFNNALLGGLTTIGTSAFGLGGIFGQAPGNTTNQIFGNNPGIFGEAIAEEDED